MDDSVERCFTLFTTSRTWEEAASVCQQQLQQGGASPGSSHARLAVIDRADIESMIGSQLDDMYKMLDENDDYDAWCAGRKIDDNAWKWKNGQLFNGS
jgi:hypothetical protein